MTVWPAVRSLADVGIGLRLIVFVRCWAAFGGGVALRKRHVEPEATALSLHALHTDRAPHELD